VHQRDRERALLPLVAGVVEGLAPLTRRSADRADTDRCPFCNTVYPLHANYGTRLEKCCSTNDNIGKPFGYPDLLPEGTGRVLTSSAR